MDYGGASGVPGRAEEVGSLKLAWHFTAICQDAHSNAGEKSHSFTEGPRYGERQGSFLTHKVRNSQQISLQVRLKSVTGHVGCESCPKTFPPDEWGLQKEKQICAA